MKPVFLGRLNSGSELIRMCSHMQTTATMYLTLHSAVQMFKTDGTKMAQAFSALGSSATAMGADASEQMAILGTLQATMSGSEAATKYTAFLGGAVSVQDKLGLSFTDSKVACYPWLIYFQSSMVKLAIWARSNNTPF